MKTSKPRSGINAWILTQVALRTFFIQTVWNFQRMQNLGFAFAIQPVLKAIQPAVESQAKALKRHLDFFVTQPYCASLILGVVARMEEEAVSTGHDGPGDEAGRIKTGMMGPLAALGDTLYWATLKPGLGLVGISIIIFTPPGQLWPAVAGPWVFLALFSIGHLGLRIGGVFAGYHRGLEIIKDLRRINPHGIAMRIGLFTSVLAGALAAGYLQIRQPLLSYNHGLELVFLAGLAVLLTLGLRRGISISRLIYGMTATAIVCGYMGIK